MRCCTGRYLTLCALVIIIIKYSGIRSFFLHSVSTENCRYVKHANMTPTFTFPVETSSSSVNKAEDCEKECNVTSPAKDSCVGYVLESPSLGCTLYTSHVAGFTETAGSDFYERVCNKCKLIYLFF